MGSIRVRAILNRLDFIFKNNVFVHEKFHFFEGFPPMGSNFQVDS